MGLKNSNKGAIARPSFSLVTNIDQRSRSPFSKLLSVSQAKVVTIMNRAIATNDQRWALALLFALLRLRADNDLLNGNALAYNGYNG